MATVNTEITRAAVDLVSELSLETDKRYLMTVIGNGPINIAEGGAQAPDQGHLVYPSTNMVDPHIYLTPNGVDKIWCWAIRRTTRVVVTEA